MSATRHATANVTLNCNFVVFVDGERAFACLSLGTQLRRPECNCMSSTRMQLCDIFVGERAVACLLLGMQLQMSPSTATLWCLSMGREQLHVCHLARNCKSRPRVQLHVFNATATLWCFVGERTIACLLQACNS